MFEYSKDIVEKVSKSGCLKPSELQSVEIALRLTETYGLLLNESLGILDKKDCIFDLQFQMHKNSDFKREDDK